jgi:hypothetical protein
MASCFFSYKESVLYSTGRPDRCQKAYRRIIGKRTGVTDIFIYTSVKAVLAFYAKGPETFIFVGVCTV